MLNLTFLVLGFLTLIVSLIIAIGYFKNYKFEETRKISNWFSLIFIGYLILSVMFLTWAFNIFIYSEGDLSLLYSISVVFFVLLMMKVVYLFTKDKLLLYYLLMFIAIMIISLFIKGISSIVILAVSFFILILLSFHYFIRKEECKRVGYMTATYAAISILLEILLLINVIPIIFLIMISTVIFIALSYVFIKDVSKFPKHLNLIKYHKESKAITFVRYFIFVLVLFNLILLSSLVIHEFGHIVSAEILNCDYKAYLFEENGKNLQTEVLCPFETQGFIVAMGGVLSVIIISLLLFLIGGVLSKAISFIMLGTGVIISIKDLINIGVSSNLVLSLAVIGTIYIILGVIKLSKFRFNEVF